MICEDVWLAKQSDGTSSFEDYLTVVASMSFCDRATRDSNTESRDIHGSRLRWKYPSGTENGGFGKFNP
jgi:hypothetical protein